jgi:GNAT superfamily N-acetyltransferase
MAPSVGSRVSIRYRLPAGAAKPLTDVVGHLEALVPEVLVRTKSGDVVAIDPADVVSTRELSDRPVRTSEIRALEHAAAMAWPGVTQQWLHGWFLRAGHGVSSRANSAVPLDFSAQIASLPEVVDWYHRHDLTPWLALPERLLPVRASGIKRTRVMVREMPAPPPPPASAVLRAHPDTRWRGLYGREVPEDVLTAVVDGEVTFATVGDAAVGRGAVTSAPDGTRWLGISSVRVTPEARGRGMARAVCAALLGWGAERAARHVYVEVLEDNAPGVALYGAMGFGLHHHHEYVRAESLLAPTI